MGQPKSQRFSKILYVKTKESGHLEGASGPPAIVVLYPKPLKCLQIKTFNIIRHVIMLCYNLGQSNCCALGI